jgi:hypothetical protein
MVIEEAIQLETDRFFPPKAGFSSLLSSPPASLELAIAGRRKVMKKEI